MSALMQLLSKYREQISYLFFGVMTTFVNIVVYAVVRYLDVPIQVSYWIAWFVSVLFAYLTNRVWVFKSNVETPGEFIREMFQFYLARLATGLIGSGIMWFGTSLLHQNDMLWNILQNVFVIVSNYVLSKLIIFKSKK